MTEQVMHLEKKMHRPGPGAYDSESMVGKQVSSIKPSSANYCFGSSTREATKLTYTCKAEYLDSDPNSTIIVPNTPGPGTYEIIDAEKTKPTARKCQFGIKPEHVSGAVRPQTSDAVGPGRYENDAPSTLGKQMQSFKKTFPSFKVGTATREKVSLASNPGYNSGLHNSKFVALVPAPGAYEQDFNPRCPPISNKKSSFATELGRGPRFARQNIPKTPGAGAYRNHSTFARQVRSTFKTSPAFGFGSSTRPPINAGMFG